MPLLILRVLFLLAAIAGTGFAQADSGRYRDPFKQFFARIEKRLVAQTQVLRSMATLLKSSLDQARSDRQERGLLRRRLEEEESKRKLAVQGTRLDALEAAVKLLRQRTEQLTLRTQALEAQVTSLRGRLAVSDQRLDLLTGEMQALKKRFPKTDRKPPGVTPPKGAKKKL